MTFQHQTCIYETNSEHIIITLKDLCSLRRIFFSSICVLENICKFGCEISHLQHSSKVWHIWLCVVKQKQQRLPEVCLTPTRVLRVPSAFWTRTQRTLACILSYGTSACPQLSSFSVTNSPSSCISTSVSLSLVCFQHTGRSSETNLQLSKYFELEQSDSGCGLSLCGCGSGRKRENMGERGLREE